MTKGQIVANTLRWCNSQRKKQGKKPLKNMPKGHRNNPESCPCGKASGLRVGNSRYFKDQFDQDGKDLPYSVKEFVAMFDGLGLPEYDENYNAEHYRMFGGVVLEKGVK